VRRDEFNADLFFIKINIDEFPENNEALMLFIEYHVAPGATYTHKFTSLLSNHSQSNTQNYNDILKEDRELRATFAAIAP